MRNVWYGDYWQISWNTWLHLRDYKEGALIEEYQTWGKRGPHDSYTPQICWLRLTAFDEQFYRENWQRFRKMDADVDAPAPGN